MSPIARLPLLPEGLLRDSRVRRLRENPDDMIVLGAVNVYLVTLSASLVTGKRVTATEAAAMGLTAAEVRAALDRAGGAKGLTGRWLPEAEWLAALRRHRRLA